MALFTLDALGVGPEGSVSERSGSTVLVADEDPSTELV